MSRHLSPDQLSAFLDGELSSAERRPLQTHLMACTHCRGQLESLRNVVGQVQGLGRSAPPAFLARSLSARIQGEGRYRSPLERVEQGLRGARFDSPIFTTFALIFALSSILYLFAHGVDQVERHSVPVVVLPPSPQEVVGNDMRDFEGRRFDLVDGTWREDGLETVEPDVSLALTDTEGRRMLLRFRALEELLVQGNAVIFRDNEGRVVRLENPGS
jgi:hypothetical protein